MLSAPALRFTKGFPFEAEGEVAIVRPARASSLNDSPICMHPFRISPDQLAVILGESAGDDDSESSPDEMEILQRAILHP